MNSNLSVIFIYLLNIHSNYEYSLYVLLCIKKCIIYINSINCKFNIESDYRKKNREKWLILHVICDNIK